MEFNLNIPDLQIYKSKRFYTIKLPSNANIDFVWKFANEIEEKENTRVDIESVNNMILVQYWGLNTKCENCGNQI